MAEHFEGASRPAAASALPSSQAIIPFRFSFRFWASPNLSSYLSHFLGTFYPYALEKKIYLFPYFFFIVAKPKILFEINHSAIESGTYKIDILNSKMRDYDQRHCCVAAAARECYRNCPSFQFQCMRPWIYVWCALCNAHSQRGITNISIY